MWPTEPAGRWLEARGNARPRGMIVTARKGRQNPAYGLASHFHFRKIRAVTHVTPPRDFPFRIKPRRRPATRIAGLRDVTRLTLHL